MTQEQINAPTHQVGGYYVTRLNVERRIDLVRAVPVSGRARKASEYYDVDGYNREAEIARLVAIRMDWRNLPKIRNDAAANERTLRGIAPEIPDLHSARTIRSIIEWF